jgi:glucans biosynthesis protein
MHGGAPGSGAPAGNRNALKDGLFTRFAINERRQANALLREARSLLETLDDSTSQRRRGR